MKLSVFIPTYNYICTALVDKLQQLCQQAEGLEDYEIIVADDGSTDTATIEANRAINQMPHCHLHEEPHNIGLSRIRHKMVRQMQFPFLLIMDSDALVPNDNFIQEYLTHSDEADVICGGILVPPELPKPTHALRYQYEKEATSLRALQYRQKHPYSHFTSFNLLIHKAVFQKINYDPEFLKYGYEDALFGWDLQQSGFSIKHISNPLIHNGIDESLSFLQKTDEAIDNLVKFRTRLAPCVLLLQKYEKLEQLHLTPIIRFAHKLLASWERKNLLSAHPNMMLFKFYKLGRLAYRMHQGE